MTAARETHSLGIGRRSNGAPILREWVARAVDGTIHAWYRPVLVATGAAGPGAAEADAAKVDGLPPA